MLETGSGSKSVPTNVLEVSRPVIGGETPRSGLERVDRLGKPIVEQVVTSPAEIP
jgi:hypothetical protein